MRIVHPGDYLSIDSTQENETWTTNRRGIHADLASGGAPITEDYKIAYLEEALTGNDRFATVILKF